MENKNLHLYNSLLSIIFFVRRQFFGVTTAEVRELST